MNGNQPGEPVNTSVRTTSKGGVVSRRSFLKATAVAASR